MKKKVLLLMISSLILIRSLTVAQVPCNLINSATFTVSNSPQTLQGIVLGCVNTNSPPNNASTAVNVSVPIGQWSYIALSKSVTNQCDLYLNGQLIYTGSYANISYNWYQLVLGSQLFGGVYSNFFYGAIDEVRISNSVRTSTEILNSYNLNSPFSADVNTIGLWHFDQSNGSIVNGVVGGNGLTNANWANGKFGNSLEYNGTSMYSDFNFVTPNSNSTIEFWIKPNSVALSWPVMTYGFNSAGVGLNSFTSMVNYTWSTGATGTSVTVNPSQLPYVWVSNGSCTDTIWFNSQSATIYDTTYVTVTDTLIINTNVSGVNPPNSTNTIKIYPNPSNTNITIDYGSFSIMNGYQLKIENSIGQQVFQTFINHSADNLNIGTWGGNGLYFVKIIDTTGNLIDVRKIVIQ